jgi:hypothetical protein
MSKRKKVIVWQTIQCLKEKRHSLTKNTMSKSKTKWPYWFVVRVTQQEPPVQVDPELFPFRGTRFRAAQSLLYCMVLCCSLFVLWFCFSFRQCIVCQTTTFFLLDIVLSNKLTFFLLDIVLFVKLWLFSFRHCIFCQTMPFFF